MVTIRSLAHPQDEGAEMYGDDEIDGEIKYYPYRKALVRDVTLVLPRNICRELEGKLAEKAGVRPDNHVVYELTQWGHDGPVYIRISDFTITFAKTVVEYPNGC